MKAPKKKDIGRVFEGIKKDIRIFLSTEDAKITKKKALKLGMGAVIMASVIGMAKEVLAQHSAAHVSELKGRDVSGTIEGTSTTYGTRQGAHGSGHDSHSSHGSHGSHGQW